jgi:xylulokinase
VTNYLIGIDSGTQSTKTILVEAATGRIVAAAAAPHEMLPAAEPGQKEQDPAVWVAAAETGIDRVLRESGIAPRSVTAIGISGQQHGFVPLDADGRVIRPAKLWCDTSTAAECELMTARLGGAARTIELLGNGIPPGFTASKILWLKEHEPAGYARLATVLLPHDYLVYWLTGERVMEFGDASGTALMDVRARTWSREAIDAIDPALASKLPMLSEPGVPAGRVRPKLAERWGLGPDVLVSGSGDNMMGAIGTGCVRDGVVTASFGTSGTIYACASSPVVDPEGEVAAFCDATGRWLPLVCTMNVTVATEMVRRRFDLDHDGFAHAAAAVAPGADGLVLVPFLEGERTPNQPDGTGVFFGVREGTFDAGHLARAAMEGVTMGMNYGLRRLRQLGIEPREIRLTGGGAKSAVWRGIAADIFDCPVVCPASEEGAAYGAALHAMWTWSNTRGPRGRIEDITDRFVALDPATGAEPDPARAAAYVRQQGLFDRVVADLGGSFSLHRALLRPRKA